MRMRMNGLFKKAKENKGIALVVSLGLIATMSTYGLALLTLSTAEARSAESFENRLVAFHWADGAIDQTIVQLKANQAYAGVPSTNITTGRTTGSYQTTVTATGTANVYNIQATGTAGANGSYGNQQRNLAAIVDLTPQSQFASALFANSNITMTGNAQTDAYDSRNGAYNALIATSEGHVGTNGTSASIVSLSGNAKIKGNATVGPGANVVTAITTTGNASVTGLKQAAAATTPLAAVTVPGGLASYGALSISGNNTVTLPAGTYLYTTVSISGNGKLNCTGQVTLYATGNVSISGNGVGTASNLPTNFSLNVAGSPSVSLTGNGNFYGAVYAPQCAMNISGNGQLFGALIGNTVTDSGNGNIHYDKALGASSGSSSNCSMKSWTEQY